MKYIFKMRTLFKNKNKSKILNLTSSTLACLGTCYPAWEIVLLALSVSTIGRYSPSALKKISVIEGIRSLYNFYTEVVCMYLVVP